MSKINNTTAYPIVTPAIGDLVILSDVSDSKSTKNFQIGALNDLFIDTFVNPDATDFQIPVFNQGGIRITGSIMSQDSSPSNGVAGTKITIAGNTTTTGDVQIDTLTSNYIPVNNNQGILRDSGFYQVSAPITSDKAIGLNTTKLDSFYGEYPDLRVATRSFFGNVPSVLDLFRKDGDVLAGDKVGVLQYSIDDDTQYAVAQIEVKTIGNSGTGNSGGGKLCIKTSSNQAGAQPAERICIDNTEADFSVPINVTNANQSSFVGQVTIPTTPVAATDAASKAYVDSQSGGIAQTTGNYTPQIIATTPSEWVISSYTAQQGKWVRTGDLIHCDFYISINAANISGNTGGTSAINIEGWPYDYQGNINDDYQDANLLFSNGFDVKMQSLSISVGSGLGNAKLSLNKQNIAVSNYYIEDTMKTGDFNNGNFISIRGSFSYTTSNTTLNSGATIDP